MNVASFARAVGVSDTTVRGWEVGPGKPGLDRSEALAGALDVELVDVVVALRRPTFDPGWSSRERGRWKVEVTSHLDSGVAAKRAVQMADTTIAARRAVRDMPPPSPESMQRFVGVMKSIARQRAGESARRPPTAPERDGPL